MPFLPVNCSATKNGWLKNRSILRARLDDQLVLFAQFVHAQDRDDVLQIAIALQHVLHLAGDAIVLLADDLRVQRPAGRGQRIDGGINPLGGDRALQINERVEVGEGVGRGGIGRIVGGNVHGLHAR